MVPTKAIPRKTSFTPKLGGSLVPSQVAALQHSVSTSATLTPTAAAAAAPTAVAEVGAKKRKAEDDVEDVDAAKRSKTVRVEVFF